MCLLYFQPFHFCTELLLRGIVLIVLSGDLCKAEHRTSLTAGRMSFSPVACGFPDLAINMMHANQMSWNDLNKTVLLVFRVKSILASQHVFKNYLFHLRVRSEQLWRIENFIYMFRHNLNGNIVKT